MQSSNYSVFDSENLPLIYSGLHSISGKGRKHLKNIAQSLVEIQNRPGTPVPENIGREIMRDDNFHPEFGKGRLSIIE